jgi:uncharacterized protein YegJ (DUF2314 family)
LWLIAVGLAFGVAGYVTLLRQATPAGIADKAGSDTTVTVADDDPAMAKAFAQAQASLPEFIQVVLRRPIGTSNFAVKVGVKSSRGMEYLWLGSPRFANVSFTAIVANTPRYTNEVTEGQAVSYPKTAIVDWMYQENGTMRGNFTACALLTHESAEERDVFLNQYKLDCSIIE